MILPGRMLCLVALALGQTAPPYTVTRFGENPIIHRGLKGLEGNAGKNINGPSLIRVPSWVERPLGKYYLYFAHHSGDTIRLAFADRLEGPWTIHPHPSHAPAEHPGHDPARDRRQRAVRVRRQRELQPGEQPAVRARRRLDHGLKRVDPVGREPLGNRGVLDDPTTLSTNAVSMEATVPVETASLEGSPDSGMGGSCGLLGLEALLVLAAPYFAPRPRSSRASE